ncbi:hypothetical protein [Halobacterium zhouii]|uniref:hypothetical protein n=1 Tax=Halobacterium zhouii TaxID=2902624 RepID=UPI001E6495F1|nr:hypothetical protein [Halobacterium zhouii]
MPTWGIASFVLGFAILTHYVERQSAGVLRTRAERAIENISNEGINHDLNIQRPISIQYYMVGQNAKMDESGEAALRDGNFSVIWTSPDFSAKGLGQGVLFLSMAQALAGAYLLGNAAFF